METIQSYKNKQREENAPHIYAITDIAFRHMLTEQEHQSILVTGESGAGKTENTKKVIQYLAAITSTSTKGSFEKQILQANPILEAFGNAQTVRNNNSSRFGKFVRIEFSWQGGRIAGASIDWYLLEKSRVIYQNPKERNYHIFYQLLEGLPKELKESLFVEGDADNYTYLRESNKKIKGVDDKQEFKSLINSFNIMGFTTEEQTDIFRIVSVIINIGNIELGSERSDQARIVNVSQVEKVCYLLGINSEQFIRGLLRPRVKAGREWVNQSRNSEQVKNTLEALAKSLYERLFGSIVDRINQTLERSNDDTTFIGVLDIAGFEIFEKNSFEQLCINYTNERLQQFFNHHMFVLEQEEYSRENIEWKYIDFGHDLQPTIDLIDKSKPIGIFSCLDEDCVMPKATDKSFTDKLHHLWAEKSNKYKPSRLSQGFVLTHYAADVEYSTEGWLEKNKDPLNDNVTQLLINSTEENVRGLFANESQTSSITTKKGLFRTVAQRHKEQLTNLMDQLNSTHPHFVRCIIPNHNKTPHKFDNTLVLDQLRCNGVLEGIRIARTGYPNRIFFNDFRSRYEVLVTGMPKNYIEGQKACQIILKKLMLDENLYKVGLTKIFFKSGVLAELEERRETMTEEIMSRFQTIARGYIVRSKVRKSLFKADASILIKRNFQLYLQMRQSPWWKMYVKVRPLLTGDDNETHALEVKKLKEDLLNSKKNSESVQRKAEAQLSKLQETLESERRLALDKEEFLKRSQEREVDLEEQLAEALDDLDKLEIQCDELLSTKKKVDIQAEAWRSELETGAVIIENLENEKVILKERIEDLESKIKDSLIISEEHQMLTIKIKETEAELELRNAHAKDLEEQMKKSESEISAKFERIEELTKDLQSSNQKQVQLQEQLEDLYKTSTDYELLIQRKEGEIESLHKHLEAQETELEFFVTKLQNTEKEFREVSDNLAIANDEITSLKKQQAILQKEEQEARNLLQAKVTDTEEGRTLLNRKVEELKEKVQSQEEELAKEKQKSAHDASTRKSLAESLESTKEKLAVKLKEAENLKDLNEKLSGELDIAKKHAEIAKSAKEEISVLKQKIDGHEQARDQGIQYIEELKIRINESVNHSDHLRSELELVTTEKQQLSQQILQLKKFIEDDLASKEKIILEKNKIFQELENAQREISALNFDKEKLTKEISKKGENMRKLRTSFHDENATQRTKLLKEKNDLEIVEKKLRQDLESVNVKCATLEKQKEKLEQKMEDLEHGISQEQKTSSSNASLLQEQLVKYKSLYDKERRDRSESDVTKRKLLSQLDSMKKNLEEKTSELAIFKKLLKPKSSSDLNSEGIDLLKRLENAEKKLKKTEEERELLESMLHESQKRNKELNHAESISSLANRISRIDSQVPTSPTLKSGFKSTNGIRSVIENFGFNEKDKIIRSPFSTKVSSESLISMSSNISISESVKQLNIRNKSVDEIEELFANYEASKRDLLSIFQDTSKSLLDSKNQVATLEQENERLLYEIQNSKGKFSPLSGNDSFDGSTMTATISDLELRLDAEVAINQDLAQSLKLYKARAEDYYGKLESAETVVLKSSRAEAFAKSQWKEADAALTKALEESKEQENKAHKLQSLVQQLEDKLEDSIIDYSYALESNKRLTKEVQDLKERRLYDSSEMEKSLNTVRDRYKTEMNNISEELEREKTKTIELQSINRHLQHELDVQKIDSLDPSWNNFKIQLEDKIQELTKANEQALLSHQDSQRRVGSLLSQIRTLRTTMEEITANRDQLQEEKKVLEKRLNEVSEQFEELAQSPGIEVSASDELSKLKKSLRQQTEVASQAMEKLNKFEAGNVDLQKQLESERTKTREYLSEKSNLSKEIKELHLKVVDLEAQVLGFRNNGSQFLSEKISELETQLLEQTEKFNSESKNSRNTDRTVKELHNQLVLKEKLTTKLQEDLSKNETKIRALQEEIEKLQSVESTQRLASRRAEREARDLKETTLRLEKELEEWKNRYQKVKR